VTPQRWAEPYVGPFTKGQGDWQNLDPFVVDADTGVVYCSGEIAQVLIVEPLGFKPNTGFRLGATTEARVIACLVANVRTELVVEPIPQGYRG